MDEVILSEEEKELLKSQEETSDKEEQQGEEENDDDQEQSESGSEDSSEDQEEEKPKEEEIDLDALDGFDAVHKLYEEDRKKFYKLPKAVTSQYHNAKGFYKRVKELEEKVKTSKELDGIKETAANRRIKEALKALSREDITVEELSAILKTESDASDNEDKPLTVKELKRIQAENDEKKTKEESSKEAYAVKIRDVDTIAVTRLGSQEAANKMVETARNAMDEYDIRKLTEMIQDESITPERVYSFVERFAAIGGYSPDGEKTRTTPKKQRSSAMVGGGNGKVKGKDDLTIDDVANMSTSEYESLDENTRKRILSMV